MTAPLIGFLLLILVVAGWFAIELARRINRQKRAERYRECLRNIDRMERQLWPEWFPSAAQPVEIVRSPYTYTRRFGRVRIPGTYTPVIYQPVYAMSASISMPLRVPAYHDQHAVEFLRELARMSP